MLFSLAYHHDHRPRARVLPRRLVTLEYADVDQDMREKGIILNHTIFIPAGEDYDEELFDVARAVQALLTDVLEDLPNLAPLPAPEEDDDDEDALEYRPYDPVGR
jgi:hypothetical protein